MEVVEEGQKLVDIQDMVVAAVQCSWDMLVHRMWVDMVVEELEAWGNVERRRVRELQPIPFASLSSQILIRSRLGYRTCLEHQTLRIRGLVSHWGLW
jgi:hypothetical protein